MTGAHTRFKLYGLYCFRLLVGAPAARTSQPGVNRPGGVFRCEISRDDSCQEIPFDRKGQLCESRVFVLGSKIWALSKNSPTLNRARRSSVRRFVILGGWKKRSIFLFSYVKFPNCFTVWFESQRKFKLVPRSSQARLFVLYDKQLM